MNQVVLIGRLTADPALRYIPQSETAVANFSLAVDRPVGKGKEKMADFIRVVAFGKTAELCEKYISKGKQIAVTGRIQTGSYKDKDGKTVYTTEVFAERIEFLGDKGGSTSEDKYPEALEKIVSDEEDEDSIPF